jgi:uncharacterized protein (TIRG00374 family)
MNTSSSQLTRRLIPGLLLGFVVFLVVILLGDLREVSSEFLHFRWALYIPVLGLTLFNYLLRFVKWHYFLHKLGINDLPVLESARIFVAGFPLAVTPGKVGEVLKGVWLENKTGLPTARGVSVVTAERITDGLAVLVLSSLGVIAYPRYWPAFAAGLGFVVTVIVVSQIRPLAIQLIRWSERIPVIKRFSGATLDFYEGSYTLFRPGPLFTAVGLGTVSWGGEGIGMYLVLIGLGVEPGWETLAISVFVLSFSTVIGAVTALPGGLGASEASLAGMLTFLLDAPTDLASAATILIRFATLWFAVFLGLFAWSFSKDLLGLQRADQSP